MNPYVEKVERFYITAKRNSLFKFKSSTNNALYLLLKIDHNRLFQRVNPHKSGLCKKIIIIRNLFSA